jgi:hypothetical protein
VKTTLGMLCLAVAVSACESSNPVQLQAVSVLRYDAANGCYANMTATEAPVAPELMLAARVCSQGADPTLIGGVDQVQIVVDYGPGVMFAASAAVPAPTLTLFVDGHASPTVISVSPAHMGSGGRTYFLGSFLTPQTPSANVTISAVVAAGFSRTVATVFQIDAPTPAITIMDCPASGDCVLPAAVGSVSVKVTAPGALPQQISFVSRLDDVPQTDGIPPVMTAPSGDHTEVVTPFPVPIAQDGAQWVIEAHLGPQEAPSVVMHLDRPTITASLACGSPCQLSAGAQATLTVTAPAKIRATQAHASVALDQVPIQDLLIDLSDSDSNAQTVTGTFPLMAPAKPGQLTIDVSVAGYHAQTITATVAASTAGT